VIDQSETGRTSQIVLVFDSIDFFSGENSPLCLITNLKQLGEGNFLEFYFLMQHLEEDNYEIVKFFWRIWADFQLSSFN
jgi:hypothetical protein